jgi:hypothetical protein
MNVDFPAAHVFAAYLRFLDAGSGIRVAARTVDDAAIGSGPVRPELRRAAGGGEQSHPFVFAVPGLGQVQGDMAAAVAGGPGGDVDQAGAQRSGAPGAWPRSQSEEARVVSASCVRCSCRRLRRGCPGRNQIVRKLAVIGAWSARCCSGSLPYRYWQAIGQRGRSTSHP